MNKSQQLATLLQDPEPILVGGVHDGLSAAIAERAGFHALWASGFCISASKRLADVGLVTMTEHLIASQEIDRASDLPVIADVDDGFGDIVNVERTVRAYQAAGIAALCMEDNRHPKRCSLYTSMDRALVSRAEFCAKVEVAKQASRDTDFLIVARTEALVAGLGLAEALSRATAYADVGADAILIQSKDSNPELILEFGRRWDRPIPLIAVPTMYPQVSATELYEAGYQATIFANQGLRAAVQAMQATFLELVEQQRPDAVDARVSPLSEIFDLVGVEHVRELEERHAPSAPSTPSTPSTPEVEIELVP